MTNDVIAQMPDKLSSPHSAESQNVQKEYILYTRRWLVLTIFVLYSASNAMQWIQYSVIEDVVTDYYNIDSIWVNWTSMVFMVIYIPCIFPASWLLDKYGLRNSALIGGFATCLGCWVKVLSVPRDLFWVGFLGHSIIGFGQVFVLNLPARLAAVWFGPEQVSSACSIGVFGNQLGVATGFLIPPILVKNNEDKELVGNELQILFYIMAALTSALLLLIIIFFKSAPPTAPSAAQDNVEVSIGDNFFESIKRLGKSRHYMLLLVTYGMNVGIFYAISTLLNQVVLGNFPGANEDIGRIGLVLVLSGLFGSLICGFILDKTHRFKETTLALYAASAVGLVIYTFTLGAGHIWVVYLGAFVLGFFMTGYLPVGFEYAAEITYPEPEGTVTGLMNASAQVFGIIFTIAYGYFLDLWGDLWSNVAMCVVLVSGTVLTACIKSNLLRQAASKSSLATS